MDIRGAKGTPEGGKMREPGREITSIIGKGTSINGRLKIEGSIRIDGTVEGNIEATGSVIIGKSGSIKGEIRTKDILVGGMVDGKVFANNRLEFQTGSKLTGDIKCKQLVISEGVIFDGTCLMSEEKGAQRIVPRLLPKEEVQLSTEPKLHIKV